MARLRLLAALVLACATPAGAELRGGSVGVRAVSTPLDLSSGPRTDGGLGASFELRFGEDSTRWTVGLHLDAIETLESSDNDPMLQGAIAVTRRGDVSRGRTLRPFWFLGAGLGVSALGGNGLLVPLRAGLGLALLPENGLGLELSAYERLGLLKEHEAPWSASENLCLELTVRFGR